MFGFKLGWFTDEMGFEDEDEIVLGSKPPLIDRARMAWDCWIAASFGWVSRAFCVRGHTCLRIASLAGLVFRPLGWRDGTV